MPKKNKTRKALKKRFKVTGTGKVMCMKPGKRHLLSSKSGNRRRKLSGKTVVPVREAEKLKRGLG